MGNGNSVSWLSSDEVWLTVLWSGEQAGSRLLVLPNEEAVPVNLRVYYKSNLDSFCNYTSELILAGSLYMLSFDYNQTESIQFLHNTSSVIYNVYTYNRPEDYEPIDIVVDLQTYYNDIRDLSIICAVFGVAGVWCAVRWRKQ